MKLEQSFEVDAPLERVWNALIDVERVAPCLPGAAVTGRNEDGTYNGTFTIKIGPTTASYTGRLEMRNVDETTHRATMHAQGSDRRGQGGATATIVSTLSRADGATTVEVVTDYHITGRLARFGRGGMIEDISERLLREFASRLQSSLASGGAGAPVSGVEASGSDAPSDESPTAVHSDTSEEAPPPTEVAAVPMAPPAPPEPAATPEPTESATEIAAPPPPPPPPPAAAAAPPPPPSPPPSTGRAEAPSPPVPSPPVPSPPPPSLPPPPSPVEPNEPLDAGSLIGSVVVDRVKRNPKPVIAVAGGLLLLRLLRRRR